MISAAVLFFRPRGSLMHLVSSLCNLEKSMHVKKEPVKSFAREKGAVIRHCSKCVHKKSLNIIGYVLTHNYIFKI